jgi:hypothetical protein
MLWVELCPPHKKTCWSPSPRTSECVFIWRRGLIEIIKVDEGVEVGLNAMTGVSYPKGKFGYRGNLGGVRRHREKTVPRKES